MIEIYWVILWKDGPLYAMAGPFCNYEAAETALETLEQPTGRCHLTIMKQKIELEDLYEDQDS